MASKGRKTTAKKTTKKSTRKPATKRTTKGKKKPGLVERVADLVIRPEVFGVALVGIAVFTILSLLTETRGSLTDTWISFLDDLVGLGAWGIPVVSGAIGIWLIIRAIDQMPNMPWQRPMGILLLFFAYLTGTALISKSAALATAGVIGSEIAGFLDRLIGGAGAWISVTVLALAGVILLTDRLLVDAGYEIMWRWQDWRQSRKDASAKADDMQSALPIPSGELPWWKRWQERMDKTEPSAEESAPPPNLVPAQPVRTVGETKAKSQANHVRRGATDAQLPSSESTTQPAKTDPSESQQLAPPQEWELPDLNVILSDWKRNVESDDLIREQGRLIQETLALFGLPTDFEGAYKGPSVTQYLIKPGYIERVVRGEDKRVKVKVSKIAQLSNDLALALAAPSVRIEAPIPGTNYIGIEVPNQESNIVGLKELMDSEAYRTLKGRLPVALGEDVKGQAIVTDLARMPHLLIAGSTGSGKSVCINSIVTCLLLTHTPDSLRLLMIDPKMVELNIYNGTPHLLSPVVTEVDSAAGILFWAVKEMERRYQVMSKAKARNIERYNAYLMKKHEKPLPNIVIVVDEMADLMMANPEEVEKHICRLAQMARAVGIHLIIATQRPSVNVITGLIKANFPARIAFAVSSQIDSRVILDVPGADRLLGHGDMLFMAPDTSKLERLQGTFLSDEEINNVVSYWRGLHGQGSQPTSDAELDATETGTAEKLGESESGIPDSAAPALEYDDNPFDNVDLNQPGHSPQQPELFEEIERLKEVDSRDELYDDAVRIVQDAGRGSVSLLQRKLRIGYGRSSRLVEQLEENGILGPDLGGNRGRSLVDTTIEDSTETTISESESDLVDETIDHGSEETESEPSNTPSSIADPPEPVDAAEKSEPTQTSVPVTASDESEAGDQRPQVWM